MKDALENNRNLNSTITDGKDNSCYGFGFNVATSSENHGEFMYSWDIRWDLYKQLGYPECKNLDDYIEILKDMQKACPKDEAGHKTYAVSMWSQWDEALEKLKNGGVFTSNFNYAGSLAYNTPAHVNEGKGMYSMKPSEATPLVYGLGTLGSDRIWAIGSKSEYPELAMEVINYLATPEGFMESQYGPKGETWDYDEEGNTFFTEHGKLCNKDKMGTQVGNGHEGTYHDGELQINNITWALDAENPDSNGETYNSKKWKSNITEAESEIEQDWRDFTECTNPDEYMEKDGKYTLSPASSYAKPEMEAELQTTWKQVTTTIKNSSWEAMYAKTDAEFDKIVANMKKEANNYGYDICFEWSKEEAAKRKACEDALQN